MFIKVSKDTVVNIDSIIAVSKEGETVSLVVGFDIENIEYTCKGKYADYIYKYFINMALGPEDAK